MPGCTQSPRVALTTITPPPPPPPPGAAEAHWRYVLSWERLEGDAEQLGMLEVGSAASEPGLVAAELAESIRYPLLLGPGSPLQLLSCPTAHQALPARAFHSQGAPQEATGRRQGSGGSSGGWGGGRGARQLPGQPGAQAGRQWGAHPAVGLPLPWRQPGGAPDGEQGAGSEPLSPIPGAPGARLRLPKLPSTGCAHSIAPSAHDLPP